MRFLVFGIEELVQAHHREPQSCKAQLVGEGVPLGQRQGLQDIVEGHSVALLSDRYDERWNDGERNRQGDGDGRARALL